MTFAWMLESDAAPPSAVFWSLCDYTDVVTLATISHAGNARVTKFTRACEATFFYTKRFPNVSALSAAVSAAMRNPATMIPRVQNHLVHHKLAFLRQRSRGLATTHYRAYGSSGSSPEKRRAYLDRLGVAPAALE